MNKNIKICIVGGTQNGSTRLFNLIRLIYESKLKKVYSRWKIYNFNELNDYDVVISKVHDIDLSYLDNFDFVLLPIRNVIDSAFSWYKRFYKKNNGELILSFKKKCYENIDLFYKFKQHSNYIFKYENYSMKEIKNLLVVLKINLTTIEIADVMKKINNMLYDKNIIKYDDFTYKDNGYKKTLMTQSHNTSNGISNKFVYLKDNIIKQLFTDKKIEDFLNICEYL
jgi:hypothetical protein